MTRSRACPLCAHDLSRHGAGCIAGWMEPGPECYCPLDWDGNGAVGCARQGCGAVAVVLSYRGDFMCDHHVKDEPGTPVTFESVASWSATGES